MAFNFKILFQMAMSMTDYLALMRFFDAAYIAAWMIDCCNLIGRKVVFEPFGLVFKAILHSFPNESEPWGNIVSSMKFTYLLSDYKGTKFRDVFAKNAN